MSKEAGVGAGCSKEKEINKAIESSPNDLGRKTEGLEVFVQDQIIIAPEIMKKILEALDLRSLKTVRLVCKSWLMEAQFYMEKRGIVRLCMDWSPFMIQDFLDMRQEPVPVLPQPFQSLNVDFNPGNAEYGSLYKDLLPEVSSLCPPLLITRLGLEKTDMNFVLPFIVQCSSTLEYLSLSIEPLELSYPLDPEQKFPNLRHVKTELSVYDYDDDDDDDYNYNSNVPSIVALIVEGSPNLDTYESRSGGVHEESVEFASQLLLKVDIKNIKTLILAVYYISMEASLHFLSIPFSRLENLRMGIETEAQFPWSHEVLVATIVKSAITLRILDLSCIRGLESEELRELGHFKCPNVQELTLSSFSYGNNFIANHFPSLKVLNVRDLDIFELVWGRCIEDVPLLVGIQTLRVLKLREIGNDLHLEQKQPIEAQFLGKFPDLEHLYMEPSFLIRCCQQKASGEPFSTILEGVKHLELLNSLESSERYDDYYFPLSVLKGIETITLRNFGREITSVPVEHLSSLKIILFPWDLGGEDLDMNKLLRLARRVEKVIVTNCCSVPRDGSFKSKELLEIFFASAPNAECGCKERKKNRADESFWCQPNGDRDPWLMLNI